MTKRLLLIVLLSAVSAHADHFHFTIPLKMQQLNADAHSIEVVCKVYAAKPAEFFGGSPIVSKNAFVNVDPSGNVDSVVNLDLDSPPGKSGQGIYYQCGFLIHKGAFAFGAPDPNSPDIWRRPKPGTKLVARQENFFPPTLQP